MTNLDRVTANRLSEADRLLSPTEVDRIGQEVLNARAEIRRLLSHDAKLLWWFDEGVRWQKEASKLSEDLLVAKKDLLSQSEQILAHARDARNAIIESTKCLAERESLVEQLRTLQKTVDPDAIELRTLYRIDEACAARDKTIGELRAEIATKQSEVDELKRSKKRLKEAIDRLKETV